LIELFILVLFGRNVVGRTENRRLIFARWHHTEHLRRLDSREAEIEHFETLDLFFFTRFGLENNNIRRLQIAVEKRAFMYSANSFANGARKIDGALDGECSLLFQNRLQ